MWQAGGMMFRKPPFPRPAADPRRIWIEELLGPALPARGERREAAIAALLGDGGLGAWQAMRAPH